VTASKTRARVAAAGPIVPDAGLDEPGTVRPQLLERAFGVLALFATGTREWTTTEISAVAALPLPTTHRIVVALAAHRYLVRDPVSKRFRLGPAAMALGQAAQASVDLTSLAARTLPALAETTQETALLTVLAENRDAAVCLQRVESPQPLRMFVEPGSSLPLHAGASQKILLAYLPQAEQKAVAARRLEPLCSNTIVDGAALLAELARIRERGWAYSSAETNPGVWGAAVCIRSLAGEPVAALGIAGPQVRATRAAVTAAVRALARAAGEMALALALHPVGPDDVKLGPGDLPDGYLTD
jgi:DNA-binding IclR family transcriptional regulator